MRGKPLQVKQWLRPRYRHVLLLADLRKSETLPLQSITPFIDKFQSILHVYPLMSLWGENEPASQFLDQVSQLDPDRTNVLMFARSRKRVGNVLNFLESTPIDLIAMTHDVRIALSGPLMRDILSRLLHATESPILLIR